MSDNKNNIVFKSIVPEYKDDIDNPRGQGFIGETHPEDFTEAQAEDFESAEEGDDEFLRINQNPFEGKLEHHALPGAAEAAYELPLTEEKPVPLGSKHQTLPGTAAAAYEVPLTGEISVPLGYVLSELREEDIQKEKMSSLDRPTSEPVVGSQYSAQQPVSGVNRSVLTAGGFNPATFEPSLPSTGSTTLPSYPPGIISDVGASIPEMKCVVLQSFGGIKNVKIVLKDRPQPGPHEVLIKARSCGINFQDIMTRQGVIDNPPKTPFIMGSEVGGEIVQCGSATTRFLPGDRVIAFPEFKAWAEYVAVPERLCFKLPDSIDFQDGVAFALDSIIAHTVLFELGNLTPGKTVLVQSAAGGVGQMICQMAKTVRGVTVVGIASGHKEEDLRASIDVFIERGVDYVHEIRKSCPMGVDIVLDCLCGEEFSKCYSLLKPMGRYVLYGTQSIVSGENKSFFSVARSWWQVEKLSPLKMYDENKMIAGFNFRHLLYKQRDHDFVQEVFNKVCEMYMKRDIFPVVDSTWCFEDIPEAMSRISDHLNFGKIVLDPQMKPDSAEAALARGLSKKMSLRPEEATPSENVVVERKSEGVGFIEALKETLMPAETGRTD